jgi:SNF2 family DNA or RNA helicase
MKTAPMEHQLTAQELLDSMPDFYALACEQGTGKTWMLLNDAERQFLHRGVRGLLVIAPKGVHTNWIRREAPTHLSIPWTGAAYSSGAGKILLGRIEALMKPGERLAILTMNVDAISTVKGREIAERFLRAHKCMLVIDESQRIKNKDAVRTQKISDLAPLSVSRRIASGTLLTQGPQDLFSQFQFLRHGLLGTNSFRAFVSEYAVLLDKSSQLYQAIARGKRGEPLVIQRDRNGNPMYRNLDRLHERLRPYMYRVRKEDCLDLPAKIYKTQYFELGPTHRAAYDALASTLRYQHSDTDIDVFTALTVITKLRQAASGYILKDGEPVALEDGGARMAALKEVLEDVEGQVIIWAGFRAELAAIAELLTEMKEPFVQYHGGTSKGDRETAIDDFQSGKARFFIGNPSTAGVGLTLTAAQTAIYFSNTFNLEQRLQSEDRCHRIGTKSNVIYIDLVAVDTIDERIAAALQAKEGTALQVIDGVF